MATSGSTRSGIDLPSRDELLRILGFVVLVNLVGGAAAVIGGPGSEWFAALEKPWFYPPSWAFGVVWTLLFSLLGVALYRVWRADESRDRTIALGAFVLQMVFNVAWTPAFFGLESPGIALGVIAALWVLVVGTIWAFRRVDRTAAALLVPYLLWVSFATVLNYDIWRLN
ncbi:TspO/MBR family protein [Haloarchaeobius sp. HME9146]|uniref:TspO/MBR family protein n=1 Tax=Haloarchaeobius sp. HME9146 TaxID=2978732 RepID=UPI0021C0FBDD|nr:TspO/MBR family protein [Haloarchaeobius sp. HME9146]MCT9095026.1 tryptophan-rich sensory protein [Haloarchaeobius sp. HME9146]